MKGIRSFSVHGHFYQPPREDPLTGEIPEEPGATPFKNWNERIFDQCYRPNAELNNFQQISFNIGPTLASWISSVNPEIIGKIVQQERWNLERFGVGNAMAQAYNHTILPLASRIDKKTQILWGIADFERLFGHKPLGMWLPETAVDQETLEVLVECGIEFTILAPWQANVTDLNITRPYYVHLSEGKKIAVFFYNADISGRVSFDASLTVNADQFLPNTLTPQFRPLRGLSDEPQIIIIASDGELYGHHQPFRDYFLARLLEITQKDQEVESTFPALWYKQHPPRYSVTIRPNTSWSCYHGVMRWMDNCPCVAHGDWKAPLRWGLNALAHSIDEIYLEVVKPLLEDPWEMRHQYIDVVNGERSLEDLVGTLTKQKLPDEDVQKIGYLLAAQFERQRMFTSCGWFFEDVDRIEPRNNLAYAAQAVWFTYLATGQNISSVAQPWLRETTSWRSGLRASVVFSHHLQRARQHYRDTNWTSINLKQMLIAS